MKKNDIERIEIIAITMDGNGIGKCSDGTVVFVPMTAIGDVCDVRIVKVLKKYCFGIIEKIITPSADRAENDCASFRKCGGCVFRHISYEAELEIKQKAVSDAFERIGKINIGFEKIIGAKNRCGYRNKAEYPLAVEDGKVICGFYAARSHRVIATDNCLLQPPVFAEIIKTALNGINREHIHIYDEETGQGTLRHIYLRRGFHSGEIMVCFVVKKEIQNWLEPIAEELAEKFDGIKSIVMNINPRETNVILGQKNITLYGSDTISDVMCGMKFTLSPNSFYQVNTEQAERLYAKAAEYAALSGDEVLLDLYCGAGTVGLSMSEKVKKLYGVEIVAPAVENARRNAEDNGVENAEFFCCDAADFAGKVKEKPDVVILDPPRKGCDEKTIADVVMMAPKRVVMISCNPATAARDCEIFEQCGYKVQKGCAVDLFPATGHVETVVLLSKLQAKQHSGI